MSESTTETATATEAPEATQTETTSTATPEAPKPTETVDFWKQKARENEARAKSNAEKAKKFDEFEDAQKSEQQRITERQAAIERERDEARAEGLRYKAAATHSIGEDYFDLLGSGDADAISGRAEKLGGLLRENADLKAEVEALRAGKPAPTASRPVAQLQPGATPTGQQSEDDALYNSLFGG